MISLVCGPYFAVFTGTSSCKCRAIVCSRYLWSNINVFNRPGVKKRTKRFIKTSTLPVKIIFFCILVNKRLLHNFVVPSLDCHLTPYVLLLSQHEPYFTYSVKRKMFPKTGIFQKKVILPNLYWKIRKSLRQCNIFHKSLLIYIQLLLTFRIVLNKNLLCEFRTSQIVWIKKNVNIADRIIFGYSIKKYEKVNREMSEVLKWGE